MAGRNRTQNPPSGAGKLAKNLAIIAAVGAISWGGYTYNNHMNSKQTDEKTGCLSNAAPPKSVLYLVDATDRLSPETSDRIRRRILDEVNGLPRFSKVLVISFGEDEASPLNPIFNRCLPGKAATAGIDEGSGLLERDYKAFETSLNEMISGLKNMPDSKKSPIANQVVRAASDPVFHWDGEKRELVLVTDGLESSIYWQNDLKLPNPPEGILRGVEAEYFEIGNMKASRLQRRQMRLEWKSWLERAGATVKITAPGFPVSGT